MSTSPLQHALREMRDIFSKPITQVILSAVVLLLGLSGPFGTLESLNFGPRLAYWAVIVPLTFGVGMLTSAFIVQAMRTRATPLLRRSAPPLGTAVMVGLTVWAINWLAFGSAWSFVQLAPVVLTAAVIAFVIQFITEQSDARQTQAPRPAELLQRIDLGKRGALISMSVQDHYVEVSTTKGSSLLLMRLSDAMRETGDVEGLQVHRSHWVAKSHITKAQRDGDKAVLTLSDGRTLPASRSRIKELKAAGILPQ